MQRKPNISPAHANTTPLTPSKMLINTINAPIINNTIGEKIPCIITLFNLNTAFHPKEIKPAPATAKPKNNMYSEYGPYKWISS